MTNFLVKWFVRDSQTVEDPAVRQRYGTLSGGVGIVLNLLLSSAKFLAGWLTGSIAITADAFNNLSDAASCVITLVGFRMAGRRPDGGHPFGHGRVEYLTGLMVALAILLVGVELGKSSLEKILQPQAVTFSWLSAAILLLSILVKVWMSVFNRRLAQRIQSAAMSAAAVDSLSDAIATSAVLLGTLVGHFFSLSIDGWVGILVAAFILKAGWGAVKDTVNPLLGQSPDPALVRGIQETVLSFVPIQGVHDLQVHDYGPGRCICSLHAEVPMDGDIMELHDVIDAAERELKAKYHLEASIHMDPIATGNEEVLRHRILAAELVKKIDPGMTIHDFRMTDGPQHRNLIFDVVAPYHVKLTDDEIRARVERMVREVGSNYFAVVQIDRVYIQAQEFFPTQR